MLNKMSVRGSREGAGDPLPLIYIVPPPTDPQLMITFRPDIARLSPVRARLSLLTPGYRTRVVSRK